MKTCRVCEKPFEHVWQVAQHMRLAHPRVKALSHKPKVAASRTKVKHTYKKRMPAGIAPELLHFCPGCGVSLHACAKCGTDLTAVRLALTLVAQRKTNQ